MMQVLEENHRKLDFRIVPRIPHPTRGNRVRTFQSRWGWGGWKKKINISSIFPGVSCPARSSSVRKVFPESHLNRPPDG